MNRLEELGRVDAERAFTGRGTKKSFRRDEEESVANLKVAELLQRGVALRGGGKAFRGGGLV